MNKKENNRLLEIFQRGDIEQLIEFAKTDISCYFQSKQFGRHSFYRKMVKNDITEYKDVIHKPSGNRFVYFALKFSNFELLRKLDVDIDESEVSLLGRYLGGNVERFDTWFEMYSRSEFYLSKVRMKLLRQSIINASYNKFNKDVMMRILNDDITVYDHLTHKKDTKRKELVSKIINRKKVLKNIIE